MSVTNTFAICLWFGGDAEEAVRHYTSIFKNSKILSTRYHIEAGIERHRQKPGSVRTIHFEINGQRFTGLNGGPQSKFNEAISLEVHCEDQAEIDYYWEKLGEGGDENKRKCGWINDKFGLWWQILPSVLKGYLGSDDGDAVDRVLLAMMGMKKYDIDGLEKAFEGR